MADKFQLKAIITGVDKLSPTLQGIRKSVSGFRKQMERSGLGNIGFADIAQGGAFAAPFVAGARAAIEFESAMADVRKVIDFDTPEQFKQMGDDITKMSTRLPMAAKDIAAIVAAGGQAGVERGELAKFAEDAVKMGIAFDQTAEQSGEMMAKWRTAFRLSQDEVVALADQVNYLSNNGPANAQQISTIVTAIGPLGEVAGLASDEIAAMGATLAGVGVKEEVAATGMKNFVLALTAGSSATKQQQAMFAALRMDSAEVAKGMQKDAQGTLVRVLTAVSKVDKAKQAAVLSTLFGRESIGAIAPMLTNLDLLKKNFGLVADSTQYAGSMEKEYASRAATTANMIQLTQNRVMALGKAIGNILLPTINRAGEGFGPIVEGATAFIRANPWVIKGVIGAAAAFTALRLAVMVSTVAMRVFGAVTAMSPIGLVVRGIALAAGFLIANWSTVGPWFSDMLGKLKAFAQKALDVFKAFAGFTPLGMVIQNWEPVVAWFKGMWERVKPYIEPVLNAGSWIGDNVSRPIMNAGSWIGDKVGGVFGRKESAPAVGSIVQQAAAANRTNLEGAMVVRFENAPPGLRAEPAKTNQPGLSVTPQVGYRSLAMGGAR